MAGGRESTGELEQQALIKIDDVFITPNSQRLVQQDERSHGYDVSPIERWLREGPSQLPYNRHFLDLYYDESQPYVPDVPIWNSKWL